MTTDRARFASGVRSLLGELNKGGAQTARLAARLIREPECIAGLIEVLRSPEGTIRFRVEKVLRQVSEQRPDLVYPWFDVYAGLLNSGNNILKWGAILTLANLTSADEHGRFERIFARYFAPVRGPGLVTAANVIRGSSRIARAKPHLTQRIVREILKVENACFESRGKPSPECRHVAVGHALDCLEAMFPQIKHRAVVLEFARRQLGNPRKPVAARARRFLARHESKFVPICHTPLRRRQPARI